MAAFQAKISWKRLRREKIKINVSFRPYPTRNRKLKKIAIKLKKIKQRHFGFISIQNQLDIHETVRKEKLSLRSVLTRHIIKNSK